MEFDDTKPAKFVGLNAQIVVCGINTRNLDTGRDLCKIHFHEFTGGVYVEREDQVTYLSPAVIAHVDLITEADAPKPASPNTEHAQNDDTTGEDLANSDAAAPLDTSREDEILAELGQTAKRALSRREASAQRRKRK